LDWPAGLDRFYDGKSNDGILSILGWGLIFGSLILLSPCHDYDYVEGAENISEMNINPWIIAPLSIGTYGFILVLRTGFRLLRQFETAEN
tara:strand:- start:1355 stop:1624 length:270 start_codon:yes stop_codon:yes gene_type:complete